jgi:MarR-like DNA-binding transcriptional regulator SgrR of sgrS sRNA
MTKYNKKKDMYTRTYVNLCPHVPFVPSFRHIISQVVGGPRSYC